MRIISDFHDYYDCIKATDAEQLPIFQRKTEIVYDYNSAIVYGNPFDNKRWNRTYEVVSIWLCGKWYYPILLVDKPDGTNRTFDWVYSLEAADEFIGAHLNKAGVEWYYRPKPRRWKFDRRAPTGQIRRYQIEEELKTLPGEHGPRFNQEPEKFRQPIIAYAYDKLVLNPQLSHFMFMRVVDPHTVYQEIRMYVDGVLGHSGRPIPDVDDKTLAEAKGFDKWSFRKKSTKHD